MKDCPKCGQPLTLCPRCASPTYCRPCNSCYAYKGTITLPHPLQAQFEQIRQDILAEKPDNKP